MNNFFKWHPNYSVGVLKIDCQHMEIMAFVNEAYNNCSDNKTDEKFFFHSVIDKLLAAAIKHFETEEQYLRDTNYQEFQSHRQAHRRLAGKIQEIKESIQNDVMEMSLSVITSYLKDLLIDHIQTYDLLAVDYFKNGEKKLLPAEKARVSKFAGQYP